MSISAPLLADDRAFVEGVRAAVKTHMYGVDEIIDALLVALFTRGHVLLEGNPGLGKTELVKLDCLQLVVREQC